MALVEKSTGPARHAIISVMQENPVFNREIRGRWRRPLTPVGFFVLAVSLAWAAVDFCSNDLRATSSVSGAAAHAGLELFLSLSAVQTTLASLFAAAVTAPTIATERETGTLLILRTAPLTMVQLVLGKFWAATLYALLMIAVPLPMISLSFVLGGVSAPEFCGVAAVQLTSGMVCASIGLLCSAVSRTASRSLSASVILSLFTLWVPIVLFAAVENPHFYILLAFGLGCAGFTMAICLGLAIIRLTNEKAEPLLTMNQTPYYMTSDRVMHYPPALREYGFTESGAYPVDLRRPPDDEAETRYHPPRGNRVLSPLGHRLRFFNPVFAHFLHGRFRYFLRAPVGAWPYHANRIVTVFIGWVFLWGLALCQQPSAGLQSAGLSWMVFLGVVAVVYATTDAAASFARERSQHMLPALLLTPLSPRDIAGAKRDAALVTAAFHFLTASPLFGTAFIWEPQEAVHVLLIVLGFMALGSTLGVATGWLCRSPGVAAAVALIILLGLCIGYFNALDGVQAAVKYNTAALHRRPWGGLLVQLARPHGAMQTVQSAVAQCTVLLGCASVLMGPVLFGLRPKALERRWLSWLNFDLSKTA